MFDQNKFTDWYEVLMTVPVFVETLNFNNILKLTLLFSEDSTCNGCFWKLWGTFVLKHQVLGGL